MRHSLLRILIVKLTFKSELQLRRSPRHEERSNANHHQVQQQNNLEEDWFYLVDRVLLCMRSDRFSYIICPNGSVFFAISCGILGNSAYSPFCTLVIKMQGFFLRKHTMLCKSGSLYCKFCCSHQGCCINCTSFIANYVKI